MECRIGERPHTVGSTFNSNVHSECILKILEEIEAEATSLHSKPKMQQKNYVKENFKRLKEIQAKAKARASQKQPLQPIKATNKYSEVQSKIFEPNLHSKDNLYANSRENVGLPKTAGPYRTQPLGLPYSGCRSASHQSVHKCKSLPQLHQTQENKLPVWSEKKIPDGLCTSKDSHFRDKNFLQSKQEVKHRLGQIPSYLSERKKQWERDRQQQLKEIEEATIPAGHTLLPDEERLETLELLKKNQEELVHSLASLPVRNDTLRLRHYKEELESQLAKVEEGIKIFSRPKVLIKNDT